MNVIIEQIRRAGQMRANLRMTKSIGVLHFSRVHRDDESRDKEKKFNAEEAVLEYGNPFQRISEGIVIGVA